MALKIEIRGSNGKVLKTLGFEGTRRRRCESRYRQHK